MLECIQKGSPGTLLLYNSQERDFNDIFTFCQRFFCLLKAKSLSIIVWKTDPRLREDDKNNDNKKICTIS